jgi:hypothetical protein
LVVTDGSNAHTQCITSALQGTAAAAAAAATAAEQWQLEQCSIQPKHANKSTL